MPSNEEISKKSFQFGELTRHKTLIWDMDETLIHAQFKIQGVNYNLHDFEVNLKGGVTYMVTLRPYLKQCLEHLSQFYEMAIFTAAEQEYADLIIDQIDPENKLFRHRLYRQHCFKCDDAHVKDLRIIEDRDLEDIVIVDNSVISFSFQIDNGVPICAFYSENKHQD